MISIIVTTHDRPDHLDRCLAGLSEQEGAGTFEVVVADDGSGPDTGKVVEAWERRAVFPLRHAWEENRGFRLARTRNRGIRASTGEYLIFIDGDCVPFLGFVRAHVQARRPGVFLTGARYLLSREETERLPRSGGPLRLRQVPRRERLRLEVRAIQDRIYRLLSLKDRPKPLGANLSAWRKDLELANGFDERFVGWGYEDEDLGRRLCWLGIRKRFAPAAARVIHLWHPADPSFRGRAAGSLNFERFRKEFFLARCRAGLEARPLADIRTRVLGLPRIAREFPLTPEENAPAELELRRPGEPKGEHPAEIRLVVEGDVNSEEAVRKFLGELEECL